MKKTLKTTTIVSIAGLSAYFCGETYELNQPLCIFFAALSLGLLASMTFAWMRENEDGKD